MKTRHFLSLFDLTPAELQRVLQRASQLKAMRQRGESYAPLPGKVLGMIFASLFEANTVQLEEGFCVIN